MKYAIYIRVGNKEQLDYIPKRQKQKRAKNQK